MAKKMFSEMEEYELKYKIDQTEKAPKKLKDAGTLSAGVIGMVTTGFACAGITATNIAVQYDLPAVKKTGLILSYVSIGIGLANLGLQGALSYVGRKIEKRKVEMKEELSYREWRKEQDARVDKEREEAKLEEPSKNIEGERQDFVNKTEDEYSEKGVDAVVVDY